MERTALDTETVASFLAFGRATVAFLEVCGQVANGPELTGEAADLFAELEVARARLRCLFACGRDEEVSDLVPTVLMLADRTVMAIERTRSRPGG